MGWKKGGNGTLQARQTGAIIKYFSNHMISTLHLKENT
jgi:hypothetical protein